VPGWCCAQRRTASLRRHRCHTAARPQGRQPQRPYGGSPAQPPPSIAGKASGPSPVRRTITAPVRSRRNLRGKVRTATPFFRGGVQGPPAHRAVETAPLFQRGRWLTSRSPSGWSATAPSPFTSPRPPVRCGVVGGVRGGRLPCRPRVRPWRPLLTEEAKNPGECACGQASRTPLEQCGAWRYVLCRRCDFWFRSARRTSAVVAAMVGLVGTVVDMRVHQPSPASTKPCLGHLQSGWHRASAERHDATLARTCSASTPPRPFRWSPPR
jgi:hypothetical protein